MKNINDKLDMALDLIQKEDYDKAKGILKEILDEDKGNIEALKNLGLCEINLDKPIEAKEYFEKIIELEPSNALSLFYLGCCHNRIGQKEDAAEIFKKVIEIRPQYLDAYKNLSMIYVEFNKIDEAIQTAEKALSNPMIEPDYSLYYIIATSYMLKKEPNQALGYLLKARELDSSNISILNSLASCYMNLNEIEKAKEVLLNTYELDQNNALTCFNLGVLYQAQENYEEAKKYLNIAYKIEPTITMLSSLANCTLKSGDYENACVMYKNLKMLYPNNLNYSLTYIDILEKLEYNQQALEVINELLVLDDKNSDLIKKKGALLRKLNLCKESIETFDILVKRGKIDVEVYYNLAFNYVQMEDYDNAVEMFKKCITLEPNNPYAHKDLGVLYLKMNCYEWALDEMLEAIKLEDDVSEFYYSLGVCYLMLSEVEKSKTALLKAIELNPDDVDALAFLGNVYTQQNDYENAYKYLNMAIKKDPGNYLAQNHLAKYYFKIEKYDVAKDFLQDIISKNQDDELINMLAFCYLKEQNYHDALGLYFKLAKTYPKNHIILTNLAKCEIKCDKINEAKEHLRQALMIYDDYSEALELLKEISK